MKIFVYLLLFLLIVGFTGLGFFTLMDPMIPQRTVVKDLDPDAAFARSAPPAVLQPAAP